MPVSASLAAAHSPCRYSRWVCARKDGAEWDRRRVSPSRTEANWNDAADSAAVAVADSANSGHSIQRASLLSV